MCVARVVLAALSLSIFSRARDDRIFSFFLCLPLSSLCRDNFGASNALHESPGGGDHSGIDAHIATLEEALDALKRERYSRECSPASGETDGTRRQRTKIKRARWPRRTTFYFACCASDAGNESPLLTSVLTKTTRTTRRRGRRR